MKHALIDYAQNTMNINDLAEVAGKIRNCEILLPPSSDPAFNSYCRDSMNALKDGVLILGEGDATRIDEHSSEKCRLFLRTRNGRILGVSPSIEDTFLQPFRALWML